MDFDTLNQTAMAPFLPKKDIKDLEKDKTYKVTMIRIVHSKYGYAVVVDLNREFQVFLPKRVANVLVDNKEMSDELQDNVERNDLYIHYIESNKFKFLAD